jgi:hypothetical protein
MVNTRALGAGVSSLPPVSGSVGASAGSKAERTSAMRVLSFTAEETAVAFVAFMGQLYPNRLLAVVRPHGSEQWRVAISDGATGRFLHFYCG